MRPPDKGRAAGRYHARARSRQFAQGWPDCTGQGDASPNRPARYRSKLSLFFTGDRIRAIVYLAARASRLPSTAWL